MIQCMLFTGEPHHTIPYDGKQAVTTDIANTINPLTTGAAYIKFF